MVGWQYMLVEYLEKFLDFGLPVLMFLVSPFLIYVGVRSFKKPPGPACPKCKYDMRSIEALSCPECGFTVKTAGELSRPRRRWVMLTLGVLMLLVSISAGLLMVSTMLEARRAERLVAQVNSITPDVSSSVEFGKILPPARAVWVANIIAGVDPSFIQIDPDTQRLITWPYSSPTTRMLLALSFLNYCQPTRAYNKYWPVEVVTDLWLSSTPDPSELKVIGQCKNLERLEIITTVLPVLKAEDFAVFEPMSRLRLIRVESNSALPKGALKSIFKNKLNLEYIGLIIHSHVDEALIEIGANSPLVKAISLYEEKGSNTKYPDDITPSPPLGVTSAGLAALSGCGQMEDLQLNFANLKPDGLGFLSSMNNLQVLEISVANTEHITHENFDDIGRATSLRDLSFRFGLPTMEKRQGLLNGLANLTNLDLLHLNLAGLKENDFEFLKSMTSLQTLYLSGYGGDGSGLHVLENHPSLKTFTLSTAPNLKPEHEAFLRNLKNVNVTIRK